MKKLISDRNKKKLIKDHGVQIAHYVDLINNHYEHQRSGAKTMRPLENQISLFGQP